MSKLKKPWALLICALMLVGATVGATRIWAQDEGVKFTSAREAAQIFVYSLLNLNSPSLTKDAPFFRTGTNFDLSVFPRRYQQLDLFTSRYPSNRSVGQTLMGRFIQRAQLSRLKTQDLSRENDNRTTILVEPTNSPNLPPVVCLRESDGWKIDLLETARKWFGPIDADVVAFERELRGEFAAPMMRDRCQSNLKQIGLALLMYSQDYDEKLPPANKWNDVMQPYLKSESVPHAPELGKTSYGYAMNWKLSRQLESRADDTASTVAFYESDILKRNQALDGRDLTFRHTIENVSGANYAYLDGHVAWRPRTWPQDFRLIHPRSKSVPRPAEP